MLKKREETRLERVYQKPREVIYHQCELEGAKLSGEIEIDDAYFGGKRKGNCFWSFAKKGLYRYNGVSQSNLRLYLKEMEYRFNHRQENLLKDLTQL